MTLQHQNRTAMLMNENMFFISTSVQVLRRNTQQKQHFFGSNAHSLKQFSGERQVRTQTEFKLERAPREKNIYKCYSQKTADL
jgi:hypothetical protein